MISALKPLLIRFLIKRFPMSLLLSLTAAYLLSLANNLDFKSALYMFLTMMMISTIGWLNGVLDGYDFTVSMIKNEMNKIKEMK